MVNKKTKATSPTVVVNIAKGKPSPSQAIAWAKLWQSLITEIKSENGADK